MLEIKNLTKIFKTKKKEECIALDNISFSLPNKGFIFVIGKSGSGKSTLLSLIGALDYMSKGDIIVDGESIANLTNKEYAYYRNNKVGFIFQDFHLIEDLTIYENINLALKLQNKQDDGKIKEALKAVDLEGYELRYPRELSGGQKQRVAIARSLVKNPSIILADEPTGNLDEKSTLNIMDLLASIAKEKLVLIVSHNVLDARKYADRILELSEGHIINDVIRNKDSFEDIEVKDDTLYIPLYQKLSEEHKHTIDLKLKDVNIKHIEQVDHEFVKNDQEIEEVVVKKETKPTHLSFKDNMKLGWKFLKKEIGMLIVYSLIVVILIEIMGLTELVATFNPDSVLRNELSKNNQDTLILAKDKLYKEDRYGESQNLVPLEDDDIQRILDTGYEGKIYELTSIAIPISDGQVSDYHRKLYFYPTNVYPSSTNGTLICDEEFVIKKYGVNNKIDYACLAPSIKPYGIYITDFMADAFVLKLNARFPDYQSIVGENRGYAYHTQCYINGIINTNYKERYKDVLAKILYNTDFDLNLQRDKGVIAFLDEIIQYLDIGYSFNPNFYDDYCESCVKKVTLKNRSKWQYNDGPIISAHDVITVVCESVAFPYLNDNEVILSTEFFNMITGQNMKNSKDPNFKPTTINYISYPNDDYIESTKQVITLNVIGLIDDARIDVSKEVYTKFLKYNNYTHSLYLDNINNVEAVYDATKDYGFTPLSNMVKPINSMTRIIRVFSSLFVLLFALLALVSIFLLANYSFKTIKSRMHEIGIIKSLGATNGDLFLIFSLQTLVIAISVTLLYLLIAPLFIGLSNHILLVSVLEFTSMAVMSSDVTLLIVNPLFLFFNSLVIIIICLLAFILPTLKLRSIKPINIIKAKE